MNDDASAAQRVPIGRPQHRVGAFLLLITSGLALGSCSDPESRAADGGGDPPPGCDEAAARAVVARLGERMRDVSLMAPDTAVARQVRDTYGGLVTPTLLAAWASNPREAPGRTVSSPWPERIDVESVTTAAEPAAGCLVEGTVVYRSSVEATRGGAASREPVTLRVSRDAGWRVASYRGGGMPSAQSGSSTPESPPEVLRRYYDAIASGDYARAYREWADGGAASGQTLEEFADGFARTERVRVEVGEPGRIEGAAGSRFVDLPVVIRAETTEGRRQRFEGVYTLRRSVVDGASDAQRRWRIHSADIEEVGPRERSR